VLSRTKLRPGAADDFAMRWLAIVTMVSFTGCERPTPDQPCAGGSWRPGTLEIHHLDVGQADATLIVGPTGRSLLVDAGEARWDGDEGARIVGAYARQVLGCARIDQALITHFHVDHVGYPGKGGFWHLVNVQGFTIGKLVHRDLDEFRGDAGSTLDRWRDYLDGDGRALHPELARPGVGQVDLGPGVVFRIVAVDGGGALRRGDFRADRSPPNENDYSVASVLRFGRFDYFLGGDLSGEWAPTTLGYAYHDVESRIAAHLPDVDVYRVNHHGSDHSSGPTLLAQLDPEVAIISTGDGNPYGHPHQAAVDRLRATAVLYLTERGDRQTALGDARVAGNVVVRTDGSTYSVNGDPYTASDPARVDADGDGYFREADPDDGAPAVGPRPRGGCDPLYQPCSDS
jgi:beta-lactamase superfamily II metal-dependent hydrolase